MLRRILLVCLFSLAGLPVFAEGGGEVSDVPKSASPRVVTAGKAHFLVLDALYMFAEASEAVVAFGEGMQVGGNFVLLLDPDAGRRSVLAPDVGVEEILAYKPDRVVLKSYLKGGLGRQLEGLGVNVLYVNLESPDQFHRDITALGQLFGNPRRAEQLNRYFEQNLQRIRSQSEGIPESDKPQTLLLYYSSRGGSVSFNVPPKSWLQTGLVQWAGGSPVWLETAVGSGWQQVSFEQIAAWDPEYVFLVSYHNPVEELKARLLADAKWLELRAVKDERLFAFPVDYLSWDQPDPRWILGLQWLAGKLHPQRFDHPSMEENVREFYSFVYGLSAEQIKHRIVPMIRGDFP